jgi:hypothetical protein
MLAELEKGLSPLQLSEEAAVEELCAYLRRNERLMRAVLLRLSPAPVTPHTAQRKRSQTLDDEA